MKQQIVNDYPPLWPEIRDRFNLRGVEGLIFSWGPVIFVPSGKRVLAPQLVAHERIHGERQGTEETDILDWWKRYMGDKTFRLREELVAHKEELRWWLERGNRRQRRAAVDTVALRLASPVYGPMISRAEAAKLLGST